MGIRFNGYIEILNVSFVSLGVKNEGVKTLGIKEKVNGIWGI